MLVGCLLGLFGCSGVPTFGAVRVRTEAAEIVVPAVPLVSVWGYATFADGTPAAGLPIVYRRLPQGTWVQIGETPTNGKYRVQVPQGSLIALDPWETKPREFAVGAAAMPEVQSNFAVESSCTSTFMFTGLGGARVGTVALQPEDSVEPFAVVDPSVEATVRLPCSTRAVQVGGTAGVSATPLVAIPKGGGRVAVELLPATRVQVRVTDAQGRPAPRVQVVGFPYGRANTDGHGVADVYVRAPQGVHSMGVIALDGTMLTGVHVEGRDAATSPGDGLREFGVGTWTEEDHHLVWTVALPVMRQVELSLEGLEEPAEAGKTFSCFAKAYTVSAGCGFVPDVWPTAHEARTSKQGRVICLCPPSDASLSDGGKRLDVPAAAGRVILDVSSITGGIEGHLAHAMPCRVDATLKSAPSLLRTLFLHEAVLTRRVARCDDEGRFFLDRLEPGEWTIEVKVTGRQVVLGNGSGSATGARRDKTRTVQVDREVVRLGEVEW